MAPNSYTNVIRANNKPLPLFSIVPQGVISLLVLDILEGQTPHFQGEFLLSGRDLVNKQFGLGWV
jgi:hypothetical protein